MTHLFPFDNIIVGILILMVGFLFHWVGQVISVVNWQFATRLGLQESGLPKEYKAYEHGIAVADVMIGWIYGVIGIGLLMNLPWSYELLWIPGAILTYHSLSYWFWTANQRAMGFKLTASSIRISWTMINLTTGLLALALAQVAG